MRLVVFDFGGTLVDSNAVKRDTFYRYSRLDSGGPERMRRILGHVAGDRYAIWDAYVRDREGMSYHVSTVQKIVREFNKSVNEAVALAAEMPGASALLQKLEKSGVRIALSSATPLEDLRSVLHQRSWTKHFNSVSGSPATKIETLYYLIKSYKFKAEEVAVVGDGEDDRESSGALECNFYPVGEGRGTSPESTIYNLYELCDVLISHSRNCNG
jgi:phosphoglycolate phosphatase-like HAD superfamily hydrolase